MFRDKDQDTGYVKSLYVPNKSYEPTILLPKEIRHWFYYAKQTSIYVNKRRRYNLARPLRSLLSNLSCSTDLIVTESDKNLGPTLLTKRQYSDLCYSHLRDYTAAYQELPTANIETLQAKVHQFYLDLITQFPNLKRISRIIDFNLSSTHFSKFRGLPKLHKRDAQGNWRQVIRPIISSVGSPTYGLSKWIDYFLRPFVVRTWSYLRDSSHLLSLLKRTRVTSTTTLATFDAVSLYTSIPLGRCLTVLANMIRSHYLYAFLIRGLALVLYNNIFVFESSTWKQTQGIAMGTPVAPTVANLYLAFYEHQFIRSSSLWGKELVAFRRYIDDLFVVWTGNSSLDDLKQLFRHQFGISWTLGETGDKVSFLDLNISIEDDQFVTTTFQKDLNLYLYTPFRSAHPPHCLSGLIKGLLLKYKRQNSRFSDFFDLATKFANRLAARGYSPKLLKKLFSPLLLAASKNNLLPRSATEASPSSPSTPVRMIFFRLTYDPNGPTSSDIYRLLDLSSLQFYLEIYDMGKVILCYRRNNNLRDVLRQSGGRNTPANDLSRH